MACTVCALHIHVTPALPASVVGKVSGPLLGTPPVSLALSARLLQAIPHLSPQTLPFTKEPFDVTCNSNGKEAATRMDESSLWSP